MSHFPVYCETGHPWLGIVEPINFATNAFILIAAGLAIRAILASPQRRDPGLWLLTALLIATGIGSFLWHGWRTAFHLALDTYSGLFFLLALVGLWTGALWGRRAGVFALVGMIGAGFVAISLTFALMPHVPPAWRPLMLTPFFLVVVVFGVVLTRAALRRSPSAGRFGILAIGCALVAATARSTDLPLCPWIPIGTHFLWHTFLSTAAFFAILTVQKLKTPQA